MYEFKVSEGTAVSWNGEYVEHWTKIKSVIDRLGQWIYWVIGHLGIIAYILKLFIKYTKIDHGKSIDFFTICKEMGGVLKFQHVRKSQPHSALFYQNMTLYKTSRICCARKTYMKIMSYYDACCSYQEISEHHVVLLSWIGTSWGRRPLFHHIH